MPSPLRAMRRRICRESAAVLVAARARPVPCQRNGPWVRSAALLPRRVPLISHSGRARASVLRRSPRRDHQYRAPLPDGDDLFDRLAVLLPWDFHDQSVGPFPYLEVGTADHPVALAAAQPSERMRLTNNNSRLRVQSLYLYATHHRMRTGRPLGQATYHARGRSPNYKRNHRICFGLESLGQH